MPIPEYAWFFCFWGLVALLCMIEALWPSSIEPADRSRRWEVNFGLGILLALIASLVPSLTVLSAIWANANGLGILNMAESPLWIEIPVTVLVMSLAQYVSHRAAHVVPLFWWVHRVHHSDVHLDASSALRSHPLELFIVLAFTVPFVVVFGLPAKILAAFELLELAVSLITHANIRVPAKLERFSRLLLITPVLHRFHHSNIEAETNSNYGGVFSFWDRLFGTFHDAPDGTLKPAKFGLDEVSPDVAGNLMAQLRLKPDRRVIRTEELARTRELPLGAREGG